VAYYFWATLCVTMRLSAADDMAHNRKTCSQINTITHAYKTKESSGSFVHSDELSPLAIISYEKHSSSLV